MANEGVTAALAKLEAAVKEVDPRCTFYFGAAEEQRPASGPRITWKRVRGVPDAYVPTPQDAPNDQAFASDMVEVTAHLVNAPRITPADKEYRRAAFSASESVLNMLREMIARHWNGVQNQMRWEQIEPAGPADAEQSIELVFQLRIDILATPPGLARVDEVLPTYGVE